MAIRRTLTIALVAAAAALALAGCGPEGSATSGPSEASASPASPATVGVYPDGLDDGAVPAALVAVRTGVRPVALVPRDGDPQSAQVRDVIAELLTQSLLVPDGGNEYATELMHAAVLTDVAITVHDTFGADLTVVYPPDGSSAGPFRVATWNAAEGRITFSEDQEWDAAVQLAGESGVVAHLPHLGA